MDIQNEIQAMQDKILNYQKLITGNRFKDEIRSYKKLIKSTESDIILLKCIEETIEEIQKEKFGS